MRDIVYNEITRCSRTTPYRTNDVEQLLAACGLRQSRLMRELLIEAIRELLEDGEIMTITDSGEGIDRWLVPVGFDEDHIPGTESSWVTCEPSEP